MARPKFFVQHFIACLNAGWQGPPGPLTPRDLEGVTSSYFVPPGTESPEFPEFWVYARLYLTNGVTGRRTFSVDLARQSAADDQPAITTFGFTPVTFRTADAVVNVAWPLRPIVFPAVGPVRLSAAVRCECVERSEAAGRGPRVHPNRVPTMIPKRRRRNVPPASGGTVENVDGVAGPPVYHGPMPPNVTRVVPVPGGEWIIGEAGPPMNPEQAAAWREARWKAAVVKQTLKLKRRVRRLEELVRKLLAANPPQDPPAP